MEFGFTFLYDALIMILYTVAWLFEVTKLMIEIIALNAAIIIVTLCGAMMYLISYAFALLIFLVTEIIHLNTKFIVFLARASFSELHRFLSFMNKFRNQNKRRAILLVSADCTIETESPVVQKKLPEKETLRCRIKMIIKKSVKLLKEDIDNIQFLIKISEEFSDDSISAKDLELESLSLEAVRDFISVINDKRSQEDVGPLSWSTAVKFMMARKFDKERAQELYEEHENIRKREGLIRFDPNCDPLKSELETGKFTILPTRDYTGAALALFTAGKHSKLSSHNITLQGVVYQLDVALESFQTQRCGVVFIYNMNASKMANFDFELSKKILNLLKGGYPARLKKVLIVTPPLWFKAPYKILSPFVKEKIRDRVFMVNVPQLPAHVPLSSLPQELGGNLNIDHQSWLLHCLKSMANRCGDLYDLVSAPTSPTSAVNERYSQHGVRTNGLTAQHFNFISSEGETDESSEHQNSVHEKQNSEDREKEVEVIKEISLTVQDKPVAGCSPLQEIIPSEGKLSNSPSSTLSDEDSLHSDIGGLSLDEFIEHFQKKGRKGLHEEYADIKTKSTDGTFESSRLKSNQPKNRYSDVLCYDHTRVKISCIDSDPSSDYVNANFVDGFRQKNAFISTQGPLPKTFSDFWRMVWEQNVGVIVMTTRTIERSRAKCGQYWPKDEDTSAEYSPFIVQNSGVESFSDYTTTNLELTNSLTNEVRKVYHMQFISWPDYGVPHSALAMLSFRQKVRDKQAEHVQGLGDQWKGHKLGPPIVVHCSAGIGRTGTFITLDICICRLEATGLIDVRTTVEKIRSQRAHSIQMPDQYVFCHLALIEYAASQKMLQDVDLPGFNDSDSESE